MYYAIDTHALLWYLTSSERLSNRAKLIVDAEDTSLLVPAMVVAEIVFHAAHKGNPALAEKALVFCHSRGTSVLPLNRASLAFLRPELDIHDSIIVASILAWQQQTGEVVTLITRDERIARSGLVKTMW